MYPLRIEKVSLGDDTIFERSGRSWFILDLWIGGGRFFTKDGEQFVTADGLTLGTAAPRTGGHIPY